MIGLAALTVLPVLLAACADATTRSQYEGTWVVSEAKQDGENVDVQELQELNIVMTLTEGGAASIRIDDQDMAATWKKSGSGVDLIFSGGAAWKLSGLSPTLKMKMEVGDHTMEITFRKK